MTEHPWLDPLASSRLVVSPGVYKIRDLLTMFAPSGTCARADAYVYLVTHKRAAPRRGALSAAPTFAPRSSRDILFPGDFYEPIYHASTGPGGVGVTLVRVRAEKSRGATRLALLTPPSGRGLADGTLSPSPQFTSPLFSTQNRINLAAQGHRASTSCICVHGLPPVTQRALLESE